MDRLSFGVGPAALGPGSEGLRKDLARALRDALGRSVRLVATRTYPQLLDQVARGEVHLAWLPPALFIRAHDAWDARLMLQSVHASAGRYYGCLFVREDSEARALEDLEGRGAAWVDASSCAGYLFPRLAMFERGIDPRRFFSDELGAGTHASVVQMVADETVDVGATWEHAAESEDTYVEGTGWEAAGTDVPMRTVLRTRPIPNPVVCCSREIDLGTEEKLTEGLLHLHEGPKAAEVIGKLLQVKRFEPASMKDYEVVRAALNVTHSQLRRNGQRRGNRDAD